MSRSTAGLGASVAKKLKRCSLLDRCIGALLKRRRPAKRESGACNLPERMGVCWRPINIRMLIFEVLAPANSRLELGKQLETLLSKIPVPDNKKIKLTKHLLNKMLQHNIRSSFVKSMLKKAFRVHARPMAVLPENKKIVLRKTDGTGLVVTKNPQGDYVLVTIDPTLYNVKNPSPELRV